MKVINNNSIPKSIQNSNLEDLYQLKQWVLWAYKDEGGSKPTKKPISFYTDLPCGTSLSANEKAYQLWTSYEKAITKIDQYSGVGFCITEKDKFVCVDIDNCYSNGQLTDYAKLCMERLNSYSEISPSGKGLRIICSTSESIKNTPTKEIEIYFKDRFMTITHNTLLNVPIRDCTVELKRAIEKIELSKPKKEHATIQNTSNITCEMTELDKQTWEKIKNSSSSYTRSLFENSQEPKDYSFRDVSVARTLAFYCRGDVYRVRSMLLQSGFARKKWFEKWSDGTYFDWLDYCCNQGVTHYLNSKKG